MDSPIPRHFVCLEQDCHLVFKSIYEWDLHSRRHRSQNMKLQAQAQAQAAQLAARSATPTIPQALVSDSPGIASILPTISGHQFNNSETTTSSPKLAAALVPAFSTLSALSAISLPSPPPRPASSLASRSDARSSQPSEDIPDVPTKSSLYPDVPEPFETPTPLAYSLTLTGEVVDDSFAMDEEDFGLESADAEDTESDESESDEEKERMCSWTARSADKKEKRKKIDNCHIPFEGYELLVRHYLLHLKAMGPFHSCPSSTCRMNFATQEELDDHVLVMHPSLRPAQLPQAKKIKTEPGALSKRKMTRQMSSGGKSAQTAVVTTPTTSTAPGIVTTASRPPNRLQQKTQLREDERKANKQKP
ncbi:MAG: hypothetical protein BYD32DRAFT_428256 [Podila humilis]|nr:MAG: hypothetical protein BYD32DRAFT_428256 [Podila humilis]